MNRTISGIIIFIALLSLGTVGYMLLEDASFVDAAYMTIITITTVGYGEVVPLSPAGKYFTMALIMVGACYVLYLFSVITEAMVEGGLRQFLGARIWKKRWKNSRIIILSVGSGESARSSAIFFMKTKDPL